jgi:predicted GTPase
MAIDDIIIAVMGATGAGKSTWISKTSRTNAKIGHDLSSCRSAIDISEVQGNDFRITTGTDSVQSYRFSDGQRNFVLVDTPGLDDTTMSDSNVVNRILDWLETEYRKGTKLNAILYLHRITDPRMQGSALRNLRMF